MRTLILLAVVAASALTGCCRDRCSTYKVPSEYFPLPSESRSLPPS